MIPHVSVSTVSGSPRRKYSRKRMCTSGLARSTTMIFATEPVIVRFPASVLDMARVSQPTCGAGKPGTERLQQYDGRHVADDIRQQRGQGRKDPDAMQIPRDKRLQQSLGEPRPLGAPYDDEESDEKHQQTPVHFLVDEAWLGRPRDE